MNPTISHIAELMRLATFQILHNEVKKDPIYDRKSFSIRIGSGKSTHYSPSDIEITYGVKMIEDTEKLSRAKSWRHGKEIVKRNYFGGSITFQNMCVAAILHEYAHFMVHMQGKGTRGSVHNVIFYSVLDSLYNQGYHEKLLSHLNQDLLFRQFNFKEEASEDISKYSKQDLSDVKFVEFKNRNKEDTYVVMITKLNPKRFCCVAPNGQSMNVPYQLVTKVFEEKPEEFKHVKISTLIKTTNYSKSKLKNCTYIEFNHNGKIIKAKIAKLNSKKVVARDAERPVFGGVWQVPYSAIKNAY